MSAAKRVIRLSRVIRLLIAGVLITVPAGLRAQDDGPGVRRFREAVTLDTDSSVAKKFRAVDDYLDENRWEQAVDILGQISAVDGEKLISVSPGRYVNVALYCNIRLSRLPADGLAVYRKRVDPQARQWYEAARADRDDRLMQKVVRHAYVSSFGDEALGVLGEWAWERGELSTARSYWKQLLRAPEDNVDRARPSVLRYPDPDIRQSLVRARLVLCSLAEGNRTRAVRELAELKRSDPDAEGVLAGRHGKIVDILQRALTASRQWQHEPPDASVETFALNPGRNKVLPKAVEVGGVQWTFRLGRNRFATASTQPALHKPDPLSYHPVIFRDAVLLNDANRIYAFNLRTGKPWLAGNGSPVLYTAAFDLEVQPPDNLVGVPRYTMTVHKGRLYAKMGSPITGRSTQNLRGVRSELVALDLAGAEGKVVWQVFAADVGRKGSEWLFEGSPVVANGRVYAAMRRRHPQTQLNVVCFDAHSDEAQTDKVKVIWNRPVCASASPVGEAQNFISHRLLTLADDTIFYSTDTGAIAALDARDGRLRWVVTYPSRQPADVAWLSDHMLHGLTPCLYHQGLVVAAPNDSDRLMAIDAQSGIVRWQLQLPKEKIRHLLGAVGSSLFVSGKRLWGLDINTGRLLARWRWNGPVGGNGPAGYGYGRGVLAEGLIFWPQHEDILVVHQTTGDIYRKVKLRTPYLRETGGNLTIANGHLLVAQPNRLVAFSEYSGRKKPAQNHISEFLLPPSFRTVGHRILPTHLAGSLATRVEPTMTESRHARD